MATDEGAQSLRSLIGAAADRLGITPAAVSVGLVAAAFAAFGGWWALRAPDPPATEDVMPSVFQAPIPTSGPTTVPARAEVLLVDVGGAVVVPGVHELRPGDRVVDAIRAAGGLTSDADRKRLNMAVAVTDGQRIWVPIQGEDEPLVVTPEGGSEALGITGAGSSVRPVDINNADSGELQTLPGIGPSLAASILSYRSRHGPFAKVDDLTKVTGIGPAKMRKLAPMATV